MLQIYFRPRWFQMAAFAPAPKEGDLQESQAYITLSVQCRMQLYAILASLLQSRTATATLQDQISKIEVAILSDPRSTKPFYASAEDIL